MIFFVRFFCFVFIFLAHFFIIIFLVFKIFLLFLKQNYFFPLIFRNRSTNLAIFFVRMLGHHTTPVPARLKGFLVPYRAWI